LPTRPKIAVLLATYNGAEWLEVQLRSILACIDVDIHIFMSDDGSTDGTIEIAKDVCGSRLTLLPPNPKGSAGQNFIRLMLDAQWNGFDYVCLSDQDDVWNRGKLARAVYALKTNDAAAYSSDVTAFWPNGVRRYIHKSQRQRRWDYLFESAGPGNTFVFPISQACFLRSFLKAADHSILCSISLHDWAFYAIFREAGKLWYIDEHSALDYRQHENNVVGASNGFKAIRSRLKLMGNGWYRQQIDHIAKLSGAENPVIDFIRAPGLRGALVAITKVRECRRKASDAGVLALLFFILAFIRE